MIRVCALADLHPGDAMRVTAHVPIAIFNVDGVLFAIDDTCTHQDASLSEGWLEGCLIECPLHSSSFDLRTGKPTAPPAKRPVRTYHLVVEDGVVYLNTSQHEEVTGESPPDGAAEADTFQGVA